MSREELFVPASCLAAVGGRCVGGRQVVLHLVTLRHIVDVGRYASGGEHALRHRCRCPVVRRTCMAAFVHIVCIAQEGEPPAVGESQDESTSQPPFVGTYSGFHVGNVAALVFFLQVHIHHILPRIDVVAECYAFVRLSFIHLDVLHGVVRQVFEQHALVATHERPRAEQEFIHLASVHEYLALRVHRHSWHLAYEVVEHRTLWQVEGRGIVNQSVAAVEHLHTCGGYHHFAQFHRPHLAHLHLRHLNLLLLTYAHTAPHVVVST